MKCILLTIALVMGTAGWVVAQSNDSTPTPTATPQITAKHNFIDIKFRVKKLMGKTMSDMKNGFITSDNAQTYINELNGILKQEMGFITLNGYRDLTDAQTSQLNQALDAIEALL